jgi:DNA-binding NarL/FixJ family response regulator
MYKILIIDDHPMVSDGITTMLKDVEHVQVIGACKTAADAMLFLSKQLPDVILLDINLPDVDGLTLCHDIRKLYKQPKILGLTSANEAGLITSMLKQGANGYLLKNLERNELIKAIDTVIGGKIFLSQEANEKLLEQFSNVQEAVSQTPVITRREKEVLQLLYEGLNGPQIAERLFLSHFTVETHRKNLLQKFSVNNTQQLIKAGLAFKLIS